MKLLAAAVAALALALPARAGPSTSLPAAVSASWETLFRQGTLGDSLVGPTRGTVVHADGRHPRVKARLQGLVWKGKTFHPDGTLTNRWVGGVRAVSAASRVGPSRLDGLPCLVMEYAPTAPVFGGVRDELRQIAPGVWLGSSTDAATGRFRNWFVLRGG